MSAGTPGVAPVAGEKFALKAHDGHALAGTRYRPPGAAKASVVFGPAMAVPQSFYAAFAAHLAAKGFEVLTFDYRGTGKSLKGSMRGVKADLTDWLTLDFDAVVQTASATGGQPLYLLGHSLGGQFAPLLPSRDKVAGLVNIAVGSGSLRHNVPALRRKAPLMWHLMAPLLCPLFGYFPGAKIGVVGDLPTGAMFQWRKWCLTPDYILSGEPGAREAYASADYPVLALTFADDELLLEAGSRMLHDAYTKRRADYRVIHAQEQGLERIGHFGFFKPQSQSSLWPMVTDWLDAQLKTRKAAGAMSGTGW
jgi:predicted alpha/beta hydrolase